MGSLLEVLAVLAVPSTPASAFAMQRIISPTSYASLDLHAGGAGPDWGSDSCPCLLEVPAGGNSFGGANSSKPSILSTSTSHSHLQQCGVDLSKCLASPIAIARHRRSPVTAACGRWDLKRGLGGARRGGTANTALSLAFDGSRVWAPEGISSMSGLERSFALVVVRTYLIQPAFALQIHFTFHREHCCKACTTLWQLQFPKSCRQLRAMREPWRALRRHAKIHQDMHSLRPI